MHIVFLIGPSSVGKTTLGKQADKEELINFFDLDELISLDVGSTDISKYLRQYGSANFFLHGMACIALISLKRDKGTALISLGTEMYEEVQPCIQLLQTSQSIFICAPMPLCYARYVKRQKINNLTLSMFTCINESKDRCEIYSCAKQATSTDIFDVKVCGYSVINQVKKYRKTLALEI